MKKNTVTIVVAVIAVISIAFAVGMTIYSQKTLTYNAVVNYNAENVEEISFFTKDGSTTKTTTDTDLIHQALTDLCMLEIETKFTFSNVKYDMQPIIVIKMKDQSSIYVFAQHNDTKTIIPFVKREFQFKNHDELYELAIKYISMLENIRE